jgi:bifunctional non-homologous end joining protein LigD
VPAVEIHHPDQLWWPDAGLHKRDAIDYYRAVAPVLLPHLRGRPFTMKRHYNGPRSPFVWLKDAPPELPEWIPLCPQPAQSRRGALVRYPLVDDVDALLWLVDFGCVDLHVWTSRCGTPAEPDHVLFDLDPAGGAGFAETVEAALLLRDALEALRLESVVRTSGGSGLHVLVPLAPGHGYPQVREFAGILAAALERAAPGLVTTERDLARRSGVFVDTKLNGHGMTIASAYSVRPLAGAPVATPLAWDELRADLDPARFDLRAVPERVARLGDLHAPALAGGQQLDEALQNLAK